MTASTSFNVCIHLNFRDRQNVYSHKYKGRNGYIPRHYHAKRNDLNPLIAESKVYEGVLHLPFLRIGSEIALAWLSLRSVTETTVPVRHASCNTCCLEVQKAGLSQAPCDSGLAFLHEEQACDSCMVANGDTSKATKKIYITPELERFISWCQANTATAANDTATTGATSILTVAPIVSASTLSGLP